MAIQLESADSYTIGWIAALPIERAAAEALLEETHDEPESFVQHEADDNAYSWGRVFTHNVVIASLMSGVYGTTSASTTAAAMIASLPHIRVGLLVGIGGAIPRYPLGPDLRLGDVVISRPGGTAGGVVQYDLKKVKASQPPELKGPMNMPPRVLLSALGKMQSAHERSPPFVSQFLQDMWEKWPQMAGPEHYVHQGSENDRLFKSTYIHLAGHSCESCEESEIIIREPRSNTEPVVHYGVIASGNTLVKDAAERDAIAQVVGEECICVEMEAAGLMNSFPCLVIRGICDYADSHKNDRWQKYAAATAAAYAKELLRYVPTKMLNATPQISQMMSLLNDVRLKASKTTSEIENLGNEVRSSHQRTALQSLSIASGASFDSLEESNNPTCHKETRVQLLDQITNWAQDPEAESVFWLNGMAGTGKSTISRTVCRSFHKINCLGASFFFKRGERDRGSLSRLFTTIAFQLAEAYPTIATDIQKAITNDSQIHSKSLELQFEHLIWKPLLALEADNAIILVIDALDECDDEDDKKIISVVHILSRVANRGLKVFITSRPELPIRLGFSSAPAKFQSIVLHEIPAGIIDNDLMVFLKDELEKIRKNYNRSVSSYSNLSDDWPGHFALWNLVEMASPLFIFASTVCRYISEISYGHPNDLLQEILSSSQTTSQEPELDTTYLPVLSRLVARLHGKNRREVVIRRFKRIVGTIMILETPFSVLSLSVMLNLSQDKVASQLSMLHSVLSVPESPVSPVRLLHLSFRDYLLDIERRERSIFWIDEHQAHIDLTENCLRIMDLSLQEDICGLRLMKNESSAIDEKGIDEYISVELQYACLYWVIHAQRAGNSLLQLDLIFSFLQRHILHWIEVLCLMKRKALFDEMMSILQRLSKEANHNSMFDFVTDAISLIGHDFGIFADAPLQIYISLLTFSPRNSLLRKAFTKDIPTWITTAPRPHDNSYPSFQVHPFKNTERILFSPNGSLLMSTSVQNGAYDVWSLKEKVAINKIQGSAVASKVKFSPDSSSIIYHCSSFYSKGKRFEFEEINFQENGHEKYIKCIGCNSDTETVAFSHDSSVLVAVVMNELIESWNTKTGEHSGVIKIPILCSQQKLRVSFQADVLLVLSINYNSTSLWRIVDNKPILHCTDKMEEYDTRYFSNKAMFSPDGSLVAVRSKLHMINIWSTAAGELIRGIEYECGRRGSERSDEIMLISKDSSLLAMCYLGTGYDGIIILWNIDTGLIRHEIIVESPGLYGKLCSIAFSNDSTMIASGGDDKKIRLWSTDTGACIKIFDGLSNALAFSPDDSLIAACFDNVSINVWPTRHNSGAYSLSRSSSTVSFSCDGSLVVSVGHGADSLRVWCTAKGECIKKICSQREFKWAVISPNNCLLASVTAEGSVWVWEISRGTLLYTLDVDSQPVHQLAFSPSSLLIATTSAGGIARLWSTRDGSLLHIFNDRDYIGSDHDRKTHITYTEFSPDGCLLIVASKEKTWLWSTITKELRHRLNGAVKARFSADNSLIATIYELSHFPEYSFEIYETGTGTCIQRCIVKKSAKPKPVSYSVKADSRDKRLVFSLEGNDSWYINSFGPFPRMDFFPEFFGYNIKDSWVTWNGERLLWLPVYYRSCNPGRFGEASSTAVKGSNIAIGTRLGNVIIMGFSKSPRSLDSEREKRQSFVIDPITT